MFIFERRIFRRYQYSKTSLNISHFAEEEMQLQLEGADDTPHRDRNCIADDDIADDNIADDDVADDDTAGDDGNGDPRKCLLTLRCKYR